jgi:hypothetical protein
VGIAVALVPLVLAGMALAGVPVPQPARSVFGAVGITLPNQPGKHTAATGPTSTSEQGSGEGTGTVNTQTGKSLVPSKGNSAAAHQHALKQRQKAQGKAIGHERGRAVGLNGSTPPGHSGETGPPAHSNAGSSSASHGANSRSKADSTSAAHGNAEGHSKR